ncbi:uncharacterized protein LOC100178052 [Ciona intestinalis]
MDNLIKDMNLLTFSPKPDHHSILKPTAGAENLMVMQTPVHKHLKVSFQTPARSPLANITQVNEQSTSQAQNTSWKEVRNLDEDLKWRERIEVVTKYDHEDYMKYSQEILNEIVNKVVQDGSDMVTVDSSVQDTGCLDSKTEEVSKTPVVCSLDFNENSSKIERSELPAMKETIETDIYLDKDVNIDVKEEKQTLKPENGSDTGSTKMKKGNLVSRFGFGRPKPREISKSDSSVLDAREDSLQTTEEAAPVKGSYNFDNLDLVDPFKTSKSLELSPPLPRKTGCYNLDNLDSIDPFASSKSLASSPPPGGAKKKQFSPQFKEEENRNKIVESCANKQTTPQREPPVNPFTNDPIQNVSFDNTDQDLDNTLVDPSLDKISEDEFYDATSLMKQGFDFNLDYLESKGDDNVVYDLRKQSLFLKFDPLVTAEAPPPRKLVGRKSDIIDFDGHIALARFPTPIVEEDKPQPDYLCDSPSKFNAAKRIQPSSSSSSCIPDPPASPTLPPSRASTDSGSEIIDVLKYTEAEMQKLLTDSNTPLQSQIDELKATVSKQKEENEQLKVLLQDFEETTSHLETNLAQEKKEHQEINKVLVNENEQLKSDLESVEKAYFELLQRSKNMKQALSNWKANEATYKNVVEEYKTCIETEQQRYKALKATMEENIKRSTEQHRQKEEESQSQLSAVKAKWKFLENQIKSLQSQLDQKVKDNEELTKICDELIEQQAGSKS